jgi:hypothetical protein
MAKKKRYGLSSRDYIINRPHGTPTGNPYEPLVGDFMGSGGRGAHSWQQMTYNYPGSESGDEGSATTQTLVLVGGLLAAFVIAVYLGQTTTAPPIV